MKDTLILTLTVCLMFACLLTGRFLRGDFTSPSYAPPPVRSDTGNLISEQNGLALLNINAVDAETLTRVKGIGETLSERIVAYREENGPFSSLDELLKVDGIGTKTLQRIRGRLICLP